MKFKKSLLIISLMICLIGIAGVSASEIDDSVMAIEDSPIEDLELIDESSQEDIIAEEDSEMVAASEEEILQEDDGTFTALQKKIRDAEDGATITLDKDYSYDEGFSNRGIQILRDITINGNGHTLNGMSKSRIFLINKPISKNIFCPIGNLNIKSANMICNKKPMPMVL